MKKKLSVLIVVILLVSANLYAEPGDVFVEGKLGVGTTNSTSKLHIVSDFALNANRLEDYASLSLDGKYPALKFHHKNGLEEEGWMIMGYDNFLAFYNGETGQGWNLPMVIKDDGSVGIGTTSPNYKLDVAGAVNATGGYSQVSDMKFKKDIASIDSPLKKIMKIKGVSYTWKTKEYKEKGFEEGKHYGVIAQEVEKVIPEVVKEGASGEKSVVYAEMIPLLIEALKEQQKIIENQEKAIQDQKKNMEELKSKVQQFESKDFVAKAR